MLPSVFLIHTCSIVTRMNTVVKRIGITSVTGTFVVGETITGGTSHATGTVYAVAATYLQYKIVTGTFQTGETITGLTASATSNTAPTDALNQGVPIAVASTQSSVACRFVAARSAKVTLESGEHFQNLTKVLFAAGTVVYEGDEITGNNTGFARKYTVVGSPKQVYEAAAATVSHITVEVEAVS
jgi:hypothetical protein